jgi:hypothetical protein
MATQTPENQTPFRQIRAEHDSETITVHQAYSEEIATAAVREQRLNASEQFSLGRMTWVKPSWNWMMYRAGFSYKDERQSRILTVKMKHDDFFELLRRARVNEHAQRDQSGRIGGVHTVVQWDPERSERIGKYNHRSIQVGISRFDCKQWVEQWILSIEDVTDRVKRHKEAVDENKTCKDIIAARLVPNERPFDVPDDLKTILGMTRESMN